MLDIPRRCGFDCWPRLAFHREGGPVAERVQVPEITEQEGQRLLRILRRSTGSVVTWRRAQMVLLSAQGMPVPAIAQVTFTSCDRGPRPAAQLQRRRVRRAVPALPRGRPPTFTLPQRRRIKTLALSRPADHDLPFATWSLAKLADFLVAEGGGITDPAGPTGRRSGVGRGGLELRGVRNWRDQEPRLGPRWGRAPPENHGQQRRATVSRPCWSAAVSERSPRSLGHPDCLSHGGSPGFKSPHLHPQTLQVRASSVECRRRSLHVAAALRRKPKAKSSSKALRDQTTRP